MWMIVNTVTPDQIKKSSAEQATKMAKIGNAWVMEKK